MIKDKDIAWAVGQLQSKFNELGSLPKKDDFDEVTRSRIKAFLGPWPRALEKAGLKAVTAQPNKRNKRNKTVKSDKGDNE